MKYIMMSLEDARKLVGADTMVLVSVQNLENVEFDLEFERKSFGDCDYVLREAATIANIKDDFIDQLRVFSIKQPDVINFLPKGRLSTILLKRY